MEERLDVIITERPGLYSIENFEALKGKLQEYTQRYVGAQFDCEKKESRVMAKNICADLRTMKKTIEDRRKEIKKSCLEPYNILENKCKELTGLIDYATEGIDRQLKDYEQRRREQKREKIRKIFDKEISDALKPFITMDEIFDEKWLNATCTEKSITEEIASTLHRYQEQYETISSMSEDVRDAVLPIWKATKDMTQVTRRATEFSEQKARILAAERERREAAEKEKLEAQIRKEVTREKEAEQQKAADETVQPDDWYMDIPDFGDVPANNLKTVLFRVIGNPDELEELRCFLDSLGLPYEESEV